LFRKHQHDCSKWTEVERGHKTCVHYLTVPL
jgi:hypothetical protein